VWRYLITVQHGRAARHRFKKSFEDVRISGSHATATKIDVNAEVTLSIITMEKWRAIL